MKKLLFSLFTLFVTTTAVWADVEINEARFPDANFRSYVSSQFDTNRDGKLSTVEIAEVTGMQIEGSNYKSLQGIGVFTELSGLNCIETQITSLNLSGNKKLYSLYCENSSLSSLTVSGLTKLTTLYCNNNQLTSLDLSGCTALSEIDCSSNKLTSLDVSGCTALSCIKCCNNQLTSLDLSDCFSLETLFCFDNQLTSLDVSGRSMLSTFECYNNKLTTLNASGCTALEYIYCYNNQLTSLDVSNCSNMLVLVCYNNNFNAEALDALLEENSPSGSCNLYLFGDNDNSLYLDPVRVAKANAKGWHIYKSTEDGGGQTYTGEIRVNEKDFPDANFRSYLQTNYGSYDGKQLAAITTMNVASQNIKSLKGIELFTELLTLDCQDNQLTSLEFSDYSKLVRLDFYQNQIKGDAMDALISSLPSSRYNSLRVIYNQGEGNVMTEAQVVAAKAKGWSPKYYNGYTWEDYSGPIPPSDDIDINVTNFPDEKFRAYLISKSYGSDFKLSKAEIAGITSLDVSGKSIQSLQGIEFFTALTTLNCYNSQLTSLDLSKNTKLTNLYCYNNQLTTLNVSGCTSLSAIECYTNQIKDDGMDAFLASLPTVTNKSLKIVFGNNENNAMTPEQVATAKAKGWMPKYYAYDYDEGRYDWLDYAGSEPEPEPGPDPEPSGDEVAINETNFPDANFRNWLLAQDYGSDGILTKEEIAGVTSMDVSYTNIQSLQGIEFFTALTSLECIYDYNMTLLDVSKNTALTYLDCSEMYYLTSLDVSKNTALTTLNCSSNKLTSLDLSKNTALTTLNCSWNKMTSLDVSKNTALTTLNCESNQITSLDVSKNKVLESLACGGGNLTSLNVSGCTALKWLDCSANYWQLTSLDVSGCTALETLNCYNNRLTSLDVSKNTSLTNLNCSDNVQLTSLNVSGCTALESLACSGNQLTSLDVSGCTALTTLDCSNNQITSLNASGCTNLTTVDCYQNQINEKAMNAVVKNLPTISGGTLHVISERNEQNVMSTTQVAAAKAKGWTPYEQRDRWWFEYAGSEPGPDSDPIPSGDGVAINEANFPDANFRNWILSQDYGKDGMLTEEEIASVTRIIVSGKSIQSMQGIEFFTALTILNCYNNQLSSLDVSKNTALTTLTCNSNELTSIKVSNTALNNLLIYCNKIKDAAMDALVESLPTVSSGNMYVIYDWNEQNEMTTTQVAAAKAKGWMPKYMGYDSASGRYTWLDYAGSEPTPEILRGDVNGDGEVDMDDATFVTNIILGIEDSTEAADVNNDGVISMPDAMFIVNKILNGKFPDE